ncbi:ATP-binding protein [Agromyces rhizosphaerae]|nr:DUF4143 domain-containing protein [Agromyces rhizosphaerae]
MDYRRRIVDRELDELFPDLPAIALDGAKGVGKTETALRRAEASVRLDVGAAQQTVLADPESILTRPRPLLIDEWERVPAVWDVVRRAVDADGRGGQFLLTGSATPALGATAHSGAGRIARMRMRPMTLSERGVEEPTVGLAQLLSGGRAPLAGNTGVRLVDYVRELTASGLPGIRRMGERAREFQLDSYLRNVVDRDIPEQGVAVRKPDLMLDWLRAYAAASSTTAGYSQILDASTPGISDKPARTTTTAYRDALMQLWLLDPVPAWGPAGNPFTRLQQTPKHQLADPALAVRLLGLSADALLDGEGEPLGPQQGTMLGHLFESLATLCVRVAAEAAGARVGHLRTRNGDHEIDLVVVRRDGRFVAIEVKLSGTVDDRDVRHLRWIRERLGDDVLDAIVVTTGPDAFRRPDGIGVVPLALLAP